MDFFDGTQSLMRYKFIKNYDAHSDRIVAHSPNSFIENFAHVITTVT